MDIDRVPSVKGEGSQTTVLLSGAGIPPILDFRIYQIPYPKIQSCCRSRAGYGFSEDSDRSRDDGGPF